MIKHIYKLILIAGFIVFLICVAGCSTDDNGQRPDGSQSSPGITGDGIADGSEFVYVTEYIPLPRDYGEIHHMSVFGDMIYFTATLFEPATKMNNYLYADNVSIYSMNLDGSGLTKLDNYSLPADKPDGVGGRNYIVGMTIDSNGNIWIAENWGYYTYDYPAGFDIENDDPSDYRIFYSNGYAVRKLDSTGEALLQIDISGIDWTGSSEFIESIAVASSTGGEEYIFLGSTDDRGRKVFVHMLNTDGEIVFEYNFDSFDIQFVYMPDGSVAFPTEVIYAPGTSIPVRSLQAVDAENKKLGDVIPLPGIDWSLMSGVAYTEFFTGGGDLSVLISDNNNIYAYNQIGNEVIELLNFNDIGITRDTIRDIYIAADGRILCLYSKWDDVYRPIAEIIALTKMPRSELPEKTILTLAAMRTTPAIASAVKEFNRTNSFYSIEVLEYAKYNTADDNSAGYTRLNLDLITGNAPDIIFTTDITYNDYITKGLFTDLYAFIDSDPSLSRDDFVKAAFQVAETDGKLYRIFPGFSIATVFGNPSVVGPETGWDLAQFRAAIDAHPEADIPLGEDMQSKISIFMLIIRAGVDDYIDWEKGTVHFDTPEFVNLLEWVNRMPIDAVREGFFTYDNDDITKAIRDGRQILINGIINNIYAYRSYKAQFGGEIVFKGYPSNNKNGHQLHDFGCSFAIVDSSSNKDAAWLFMKILLDKDWQLDNVAADVSYSSRFPTNLEAFNITNEAALVAGDKYSGSGAEELVLEPPTRDDIDMIIQLINAAGISDSDDALLDIIRGDALDFFNGIVSAQQAARNIQSRVSIYVAERS